MQGYVDEHTYRQFLMDIRTASVKYRTSKETIRKREAWSDMIVAISNLLRPLPDSDIGAIQTLIELQGALGDLNEGRIPEVLKVAVKSKQRDNNTYQIHLGAAVAIVDLLVEEGAGEDQALRKAIALLRKGGAELPRRYKKNRPPSKGLKTWRKRLHGNQSNAPRFQQAKEGHKIIRDASRLLQDEQGLTKSEANRCIIEEIWPQLMR